MMDYELFKTVVTARIMEKLPPIYRKYEPKVAPVYKVNQKLDAFRLFPKEKGVECVAPVLYLNEVYQTFKETQDLDNILELIAGFIMHYQTDEPAPPQFDFNSDFDWRSKVLVNVINAEKNREYLETLPHKEFLDLAVIFRIVIPVNEEVTASAVVTKAMAEILGVDADTLYEQAMKNREALLPWKVYQPNGDKFAIVTNEQKEYGASSILYEEMRDLEKKIGEFYIMPMSLNEVFAIPSDSTDVESLKAMLSAGNDTINREEDFLSDSIYVYKNGEISFA